MGNKKRDKQRADLANLPVDITQVQQQLEQYRQVAQAVRSSMTPAQVETAIASINEMTEATQVAFLKALTKEGTLDAADVLQAINLFAALKETRKAARRALIQLEEIHLYPRWKPPVAPSLITEPDFDLNTSSREGEAIEDSEEDEFEDDEESLDPYASLSSLLEEIFAMSEAGELATSILEDWVDGDYEAVYDHLASNSPLRDGLARDEWVARRRAWNAEAEPANFRHTYVRERDADDDDDAPFLIDAGWSFEFTDTPLSRKLKELPVATAVYQETRRHWFWSSYTFVEEDGEMRLHSITDEGTALRNLSVEELKSRMDEIAELASDRLEQLREEAEGDEYADEDEDIEDEDFEDDEEEEDEDDEEELEFGDMANRLQEALQVTTTALHYADALIAQAPLDSPEIYTTAFEQAEILQDHERAAVYMQQQMEHFPDLRADALQKLAIAHFAISEAYDEEENEEQKVRFFELAEKDLRDSLAIKKTPFGAVLLAQTLIAQGKGFDEAEELLHQAQEFETAPRETTLIEVGLGLLAQHKEDYEQALLHYQRAAEISPDFPGIWFSLGQMQHNAEQYEAAEQSFLRAVEENPEQLEAYMNLAAIYTDYQHDPAKAQEILEEGLEENPDSAELMASLALLHLENQDLRTAHEYLIDAESTDPELEIVQIARQRYNAEKGAQRQSPKLKSKQHKPKKKK